MAVDDFHQFGLTGGGGWKARLWRLVIPVVKHREFTGSELIDPEQTLGRFDAGRLPPRGVECLAVKGPAQVAGSLVLLRTVDVLEADRRAALCLGFRQQPRFAAPGSSLLIEHEAVRVCRAPQRLEGRMAKHIQK